MRIILDVTKSIDQNAARYFEKAKQAKRKIEGLRAFLEKSSHELAQAEQKEQAQEREALQREERKQKREWFEKLHWFYSSDGLLCIGGRDATSNEIVIKKHADKNDLVLHTDMAGSPFFVIKSEGKEIPPSTIEEAGIATASYSRAWKNGLQTLDVFYVKPEQVSKEAQAGEFVAKGAFMIRGRTSYLHPTLGLAIGVKDDRIMAGPLAAVKKHCKDYVQVIPGDDKPSDVAKKIRKKLGGELDDIVRALPAGNSKLVT